MPQGRYETANGWEDKERPKGNPLVLRVWDEFTRAHEIQSPDRERNRENWKIYWGVDGSQYPDGVLNDLKKEGRDPDTYNIATQKVDSLTGAILKNPFETDYIPIEGETSPLTNAVKQAYLSDKELMDWDGVKEDLVSDGLVYESDIEMYIDDKYHFLGNIGLRRIQPGHLVKDPFWQTNSTRDLIKVWKVSYLTPRQIRTIYKNLNSYYIEHRLAQNKWWGDDYGDWKDILPNFYLEQNDGGDRLQVIEQYEMIDEVVEVEYDRMTGLELPETEDLIEKVKFLDKTNPFWTPEGLSKRKKTKKVCHVVAICPDLGFDVILEQGPTEVQVGRLPFFSWSASRKNGKCRGIIDLIKDVQRNINYREALITYMIQTQAHSPELIDPQLFNDDIKFNDYKANKNNPSRVFETASGALARGLAPVKVFSGGIDPNVTDQLMRMWDVADRISKAPAVSDGRTEGSGESGYLFAQKQALAEQQQYVLFSGLKRVENEIGEAYLEQAKRQYSLGGVKREFKYDSGKSNVLLNESVMHENGQISIENDISMLARHKVIVSDSPAGITARLTTRALSVEMLNSIPEEKIGSRNVLANTMMNTVDNLSEKAKANLKEIQVLEDQLVIEQLTSQISGLKSQRLQSQQQIDQIEMAAAAAANAPVPGVDAGAGGQDALPPGVDPAALPPPEAQAELPAEPAQIEEAPAVPGMAAPTPV